MATDYEAAERQRSFDINMARDRGMMLERDAAQRRSEASGLRNQRLQELEQCLEGLSGDAWRGLDPARAAGACLGLLEQLMGGR